MNGGLCAVEYWRQQIAPPTQTMFDSHSSTSSLQTPLTLSMMLFKYREVMLNIKEQESFINPFGKQNISPDSSCSPLDNVWPYCPSTRHFFRIKIHAIMNKKRPRIMTLQLPKLTKNRILGETRGSYWVPATGYTCHWRHHLGSRCLICPPYSPAKPWRCIHTSP